MAEFRNEAKAAQHFVDKTLQHQKKLDQQAAGGGANNATGGPGKAVGEVAEEFEQLHPRAFKGTQPRRRRRSKP